MVALASVENVGLTRMTSGKRRCSLSATHQLTKLSHLAHTQPRSTACSVRAMSYDASVPASIFPLLRRWRSSLPHTTPPFLAQSLRVEAQRCFRLAHGIASVELAGELEAIGRAFESEAVELETRGGLSVEVDGRAA